MEKCSICKTYGVHFYYCGKECQKKDWSEHKGVHKRLKTESDKYLDGIEALKLLDHDSKAENAKVNIESQADVIHVWLGISSTTLMQYAYKGACQRS